MTIKNIILGTVSLCLIAFHTHSYADTATDTPLNEQEEDLEGYIDDESAREIDPAALGAEKSKLKTELLNIQQQKVELKSKEIELQKAMATS